MSACLRQPESCLIALCHYSQVAVKKQDGPADLLITDIHDLLILINDLYVLFFDVKNKNPHGSLRKQCSCSPFKQPLLISISGISELATEAFRTVQGGLRNF